MAKTIKVLGVFPVVVRQGRKGHYRYTLRVPLDISERDAQFIDRLKDEVTRRRGEVDRNIISTPTGSFSSYVAVDGRLKVEIVDGNESQRRQY